MSIRQGIYFMSTTTPVLDSSRIHAVDAARGFALLGIFCVNIALFAHPFGEMMNFRLHGPVSEQIADAFVSIFCEFKFYGLFSLLFGIGFALQTGRLKDTARSWKAVYLRRILILALIGLVHALLIWFGDILFIYSFAALALLAGHRLRPRTLAIIGAIILAAIGFLSVGLVGLQSLGQRPQAAAVVSQNPTAAEAPIAEVIPPSDSPFDNSPATDDALLSPEQQAEQAAFWSTPFGRLIHGFKEGKIQDPSSPLWQSLEQEAYQHGPYTQLFLFRAFTFVMMLVFTFFGFITTVVAFFFIGAALARSNAFAPDKLHWHWRFVGAATLIGLPLCATGVLAHGYTMSSGTAMLRQFAQSFGAPLLSLGYLGAITLLVHSGKAAWLTDRLIAAGRMALTNYLTQSLIATTIFYFYGLGYFGKTNHAQELAIVACIYALQLFVISPLWMSRFRFGPMEWLWRSATYLKRQPMRR